MTPHLTKRVFCNEILSNGSKGIMSDKILELKLIGLKTTGPLSSIISLQRQLKLEPKKVIHLFPEMRVTKKVMTQAAVEKFLFINLIEFLT